MKKLGLALVLAAITIGANAQTEKGKKILGGEVSLQSQKVEGSTNENFSFTFLPAFGYFVKDNLALGTGIGYRSNESSTSVNNAIIVAPFGRYYVNVAKQFKFYTELSVPLSFGADKTLKADGSVDRKTASTTNIGVNLSPGFVFFPTTKIGVQLSFSGLYFDNETKKTFPVESDDPVAKTTTNTFGLGFNSFSPSLGVFFHF